MSKYACFFNTHSYCLIWSCAVFFQHVETEYKSNFEAWKYTNISLIFACIKASLHACGCVEVQCKVYADYI